MTVDGKNIKIVQKDGNIALYEFSPSLNKLLYFNFIPMKLSRRIRLILEYLGKKHYIVYYLEVSGELVGYCLVAPGGRRLKCAKNTDIVVGPYFIDSKFRGKGYSKVLIELTLKNCSYSYENAYVYIKKSNIPSLRASEACGFTVCGEVDIVGIMHSLVERNNGEGTHLVYKKGEKNGC